MSTKITINQVETSGFDVRYTLSGTGGDGGAGDLKADGSVPLTADWNVGSHKITSLTNPTTNQGAATKKYVDDNAGTGDVVGPGSVTDGHLAVFDGVTGKLIKDGGAASSGAAWRFINLPAGS